MTSRRSNARRQRRTETTAPLSAHFSPLTRRRLSAPGLRTFLAIADLWGMTERQRRLVLRCPSPLSYRSWVRIARTHSVLTLNVDVLTRISMVLGIHQALGVLFQTEADRVAWLRGPHQAPVFGGRPPLALITGRDKDSLLAVRRFLEAACTGLYMPPNEVDREFEPYTDAQIVGGLYGD